MVKKEVLFGWFGKSNLGDDIMLNVYVKNSHEKLLLVTFSYYYNLDCEQVVVKSRLGYLLNIFFYAIKYNNICFIGGSVFRDVSFGLTLTFFTKIILLKILGLFNGNIKMKSTSIGPLRTSNLKLLLKSLPGNGVYSLRDNRSLKYLQQAGFSKATYELDSSSDHSYPMAIGGAGVGLSLSDSLPTKDYAELDGLEAITLVSLCENTHNSDSRKIKSYCQAKGIDIQDEIIYKGDINRFLEELTRLDLIYAERLHALFVARHIDLAYKPLVNSDKVANFVKEGIL